MPRHIFPGDLHLLLSGAPAVNAPFTVWDDRVAGSPVTDLLAADGVSTAALVTDSDGLRAALYGPNNVEVIYVDTGASIRFPVYADDSLRSTLDESFLSGVTTRLTALESGGGGNGVGLSSYSQVQSLSGYPSSFPPASHSHPSGQISDSTATGRAVVTAADAQAARAAIGAGTGNGTSNLTLGTTATTAAAGSHTHAASAISFSPSGAVTAQDVQTAIVQASQSGGGTGTSSRYDWIYASGAYPTLPTTRPAGVNRVDAIGPTYPTVIPSWVGLGASQAKLSYSKVALT